MSRALLIGNGAREHAIAGALSKSGVEVIAFMDKLNPGIATLASEYRTLNLTDIKNLPSIPGVDYAIIGPEAPLDAGIVDHLETMGVQAIGPYRVNAKIETSKAFAREFLEEICPEANPEFCVIRNTSSIDDSIDAIGLSRLVIKPDGLTGGKGVRIFGEHIGSKQEAESYAKAVIGIDGSAIFEEKLNGIEFTIQSFVDGTRVRPMPLVRDYKRAFDDDQGPNTGSMGSYSRSDHGLEYVSEPDYKTALGIMELVVRKLKQKTGMEYRGILYGQFMQTELGVKVIEFNARFGDPEAMNVLSILDSSMDDICQGIIDGNLGTPNFLNKATVCVYIVPVGYPGEKVAKDEPVIVGESSLSKIYHASIYEKDDQIYTTGSRSLAVLSIADTVSQARENAYNDVTRIKGKIRYRTDIAKGVV